MNINNNYLAKVKKENFRNKLLNFTSIMFTVIIMVSIIFQCNVKASSSNGDPRRDMFYVKIINYTMPFVKVSSFDTDDLAESATTIKDKIFSLFSVDFKDPLTYISKEIAYLNVGNSSTGKDFNEQVFKLNPFRLQDNDVKKTAPSDAKQGQNKAEDNIPDVKATVVNPSIKKTLNLSKPEILIYHTHTSEAFAPFSNPNSYNSFDETKNVCAVGDGIAQELQKNYGISVLHDKTIHNYLDTGSYLRSRETLSKYLKKYGDFKIIIDLHRDDGPSRVVKINGERTAQIMFVMTEKNPHYDKNIAMVNSMLSISKKLFPGFAVPNVYHYNYGTKYFNQDLSNNACLIEVGTQCNTIDEAKASSKYIARILAEYLNGKK